MLSRIKTLIPSKIWNHLVQSTFARKYYAESLAKTSKRLDICAFEIANSLHLAEQAGKNPIRNKICLEIGAGWVLSHSLIFHLLGAKRVYSTDIVPNAIPSSLKSAIRNSTHYAIRDCLSAFEDHTRIRSRLNQLDQWREFTFRNLRDIGVYYMVPMNFVTNTLETKVDFIYSNAVLEHIPKRDIQELLINLSKNLSSRGVMIHNIHLEDHKDSIRDPFAFLSESDTYYDDTTQSNRGNRIRASEWLDIFNAIPNLESRSIYSFTRDDVELPKTVDSSIKYRNEADLRTSNLGVIGIKK